MAFIKVADSTRNRINKIKKRLKKKNPKIRNSITQDYVLDLALVFVEGK